jgi:hypothetical protein
MIKDNEIRIKEKVNFFMDEKVDVHIQLLDKTFLNGIILKELREGVYWFKEKKLGKVYLFLKDIYEVEQYNQKEGEK